VIIGQGLGEYFPTEESGREETISNNHLNASHYLHLSYWVWYDPKVNLNTKSAIILSAVIFPFLFTNILNYHYFHTDLSAFIKNNKRWKIISNVGKII